MELPKLTNITHLFTRTRRFSAALFIYKMNAQIQGYVRSYRRRSLSITSIKCVSFNNIFLLELNSSLNLMAFGLL